MITTVLAFLFLVTMFVTFSVGIWVIYGLLAIIALEVAYYLETIKERE